mgnify:CR=1 FL=1
MQTVFQMYRIQRQGTKQSRQINEGKKRIFWGKSGTDNKNQIEQRKKMAQKSALKLVKDAWDNDQAVEKTVASQRQRYAELDAQRTEQRRHLPVMKTRKKHWRNSAT